MSDSRSATANEGTASPRRELLSHERSIDDEGVVSESTSWQLSDEEADRLERLQTRFAEVRPLVERRTDDPIGAVWSELERFTGTDAVSRALQNRSGGRKPNAWQVMKVRQAIRLASAYFASYRNADPLIAPPQLYYGAMHLAEAVAFLTLRRALPQSHGTYAPTTNGSLRDATIVFEGFGTQQALSGALGGDQLGAHGSAAATISVFELLRSLPDMHQTMEELTGEGTRAFPVFRVSDPDPKLERAATIGARLTGGEAIGPRVHVALPISDLLTSDAVEDELAIYPALMDRHAVSDGNGNLCWRARGAREDDFRTLTLSTPYGFFFERRLSNGAYLPEMSIILALLHFVSTLSRYRALEWMRLLDDRSDDFSIIRDLLAISEKKMANLALNELTQRVYDFQHT